MSSRLAVWPPGSTMRQLSHIHCGWPGGLGNQLQRHCLRIEHDPTTDSSATVIAPASPSSTTSLVSQRTQRSESKNTSLPQVGQFNRTIARSLARLAPRSRPRRRDALAVDHESRV